jgi:aspartate racemase
MILQLMELEAMKEQTVGVIGGMGPEVTVQLMRRVIAKTPAIDDADHIHMIVDNDPIIPSRISKLLAGIEDDPLPYLANMARKLHLTGVDFLVMPFNTAHLIQRTFIVKPWKRLFPFQFGI